MVEIEKTKKKGFIRRGISSMTDVKRWSAWDEVKGHGKMVVSTAKWMFVPKKPERKETYEEAIVRLGFDEKTTELKKKSFLRLALFYIVLALGMFGYAVYVFINGHMMTSFLCLVLTILLLVYAFREHFWYIQLREKKFGCTLKEWWKYTLTGSH